MGAAVHGIEKMFFVLYNICMEYKVVETSTVTDEEIENILNDWTRRGYSFDSVHFVVKDSSRRPGMAFIFFTKTASQP